MADVLLDTTVLVDALRGRPAARRLRLLRLAGDRPWACALNIDEVVRGLHPDEEERARRLLGGLRIVPLGAEEGWRAGEWRRELGRRGVTISQADALIAAAALAIGGRLATGNPKHFPLPELTVEHWPAGA
ncbi:MAG: PIN domain-containing protein [Thermoleophilia bacterium]|nr:PIN domain-containing protein [Thermoleophilia bacterium]